MATNMKLGIDRLQAPGTQVSTALTAANGEVQRLTDHAAALEANLMAHKAAVQQHEAP